MSGGLRYLAVGLFLCALATGCNSGDVEPVAVQSDDAAAAAQLAPPTERSAAHCGDLDVLGTDPSGRYLYCASTTTDGLTQIFVDDGSGQRPAFADEQRRFRLGTPDVDGRSTGFRFVDATTAVWPASSWTVAARIDDSGSFVDLYEFAYPFHDYSLRDHQVDEQDLIMFGPAFVNSSVPKPDIETRDPLLDNFPETDPPIDGSWYRGTSLAATPACGSSALYRDEAIGFSRVLDPAVELDAVHAVKATNAIAGPSGGSASLIRLIAIAVSCPEDYEGHKIYLATESINYGDNGPRSSPQVDLWGSHDGQDDGAFEPILAPAGHDTYDQLVSIQFPEEPADFSPVAAVLNVVDLDGNEHEIIVYNEVDRDNGPPRLRTEGH